MVAARDIPRFSMSKVPPQNFSTSCRARVRGHVDRYKDGLSSNLANVRAGSLCLDPAARTAWS